MGKGSTLQTEMDFTDSLVFAEANMERYYQMWLPVNRNHHLLHIERTIPLPSKVPGNERKIVITPAVGYSAYNITTKNVFYALTIIWLTKGMPTEPWQISLSAIARQMGKSLGKKVLAEIKHQLNTLAFTNTRFVDCFEIKNTDGETEEEEQNLKILSTYNPKTRKDKNGKTISGGAMVQFDDVVLNSLRSGNVIPANVQTMISISCPISAFVYMKYDNILCSLITKNESPIREITIDNLLIAMSLEDDTRFTYPSWKKELAERIAKHLQGACLSTEGVTLKITPALTSAAVRAEAAGEPAPEYKLIFEAIGEPKKHREGAMEVINPPYVIESMVNQMIEICGQIQDPVKTTRTFTHMARVYPHHVIYRAISETKDAVQSGNRKGDPIKTIPAYLNRKVQSVYADTLKQMHQAKTSSKRPALVIDG